MSNYSIEVINPGDNHSTAVKIPTEGAFDKVREIIGGYVQVVPTPMPVQGNIMLCDEDGGMKSLPLNITASRLANMPILGTVVICVTEILD